MPVQRPDTPAPAPASPGPRPWALVLAAGTGSRMAQATGNTPKQFLPFAGAPLYWASALTLSRAGAVAGIVFVFPPAHLAAQREQLARLDAGGLLGLPWRAVAGGERRQDSVANGLAALPREASHVLVHDAARPFASAALVNRVIAALAGGARAAIPGVAVNDTIKVVREGHVLQTLERDTLAAVQTPQGFALPDLLAAHARCREEGWTVTDDAALVERCGLPVLVVAGEPANVKITRPEDLPMLAPQSAPHPCVGYGYDVHRFAPTAEGATTPQPARSLRLGGVPIPGGPCVLAHSDGDVLLHALMDAILGAAAAGDIGQLFPDNAPHLDGVDSAVLLDDVLRRTSALGVRVTQIDVTIIAQKPRIAPHKAAIHKRLCALLGLAPDSVNVKATTEEGLGFTGALQGIKAVAVVMAQRTPTPVSGSRPAEPASPNLPASDA